jgi:predicted lipoprotein with Yx(FWY)xxD motif
MSLPRSSAAAISLAAVALIVAGCGGGSSSSSTSSTSSQGGTASTLSGAEVPQLGAVLVDSEGLTVYAYGTDQGTTSSCYGACEEAWPPVIANGTPTAGEGATSSELATTKRKDGSMQVTYAGHPLYLFIEDKKPGEANGNGVNAFGAKWNALDESGSAPSESGSESAAGAESGGGGYSGY